MSPSESREIPAPRAVLVDAGVRFHSGDSPSGGSSFRIEYPWSDWSDWQHGPWENVGDPWQVGSRYYAARRTLFTVLEYDEVRQFMQRQRRMVWRTRRNANGECEAERRFEDRITHA